jgi:hypothetical protein
MKINAGENWIFQTVTHYVVGTVESIDQNEIWLKPGTASWIAVTGRFHNFMKVGVIKETEVEPFGNVPVMIKQGAIVISAQWTHPLPLKQQ